MMASAIDQTATLMSNANVLVSHAGRLIANFVVKFPSFRHCGNKGGSGVNFNDTVKLTDSENPRSDARICDTSVTHAEL